MRDNWINIIQDYFLPTTCLLCGNSGFDHRDLCQSCYLHLPRNERCCYQCAQQLPIDACNPMLCGRCLSLRPAFDETYAPFMYQGAIRYLITRLKFRADYKNARLLGLLLAEYLQKNAERPELIIPVPLHNSRYRQRGFNQSIEIARAVAKKLDIPLDFDSCRRLTNTLQQSKLSLEQRQSNVKRAFALVKPVSVHSVAILDDVMTTGSTANEIATILKNSGVDKVDVWVCARA